MRCNAPVYEGSEPYLFISYCHQDQAEVYPYIEMLSRDGYRVWYDEGITPGDEWTENIAKHLEASSVFIAFITEASINSHNCRREINFAIQRNKNFVSLFLDDVRLSAGMEMLLSSVQGIYRSQYPGTEAFMNKLFSTAVLEQCRGEGYMDKPISREAFDDDETVTLTQGAVEFPVGSLETYLMRIATLERIFIRKTLFTIGRSHNHADHVISGESSISRKHATIRKTRDAYMITDNNSLNHVGINGRLIAPGVEYEITGFDIISLAKEHLVFFKNYNESGLRLMPGYGLQDDRDIWSIPSAPVVRIGSRQLQPDGHGSDLYLPDESIMPVHAILIGSPEGLYAADLSGIHGTAVNGRTLMFCEKVLLQPGDILTVGRRSFKVVRGL